MTDRTHPDSGRIITSGDVIAELQDRIAELEAEIEAVGAGGVQALSAAPAVPNGDELRRIARSARTSASDDASPTEYVLAGWKAAMLAASPTPPAEQQAAPKAATVKACVCGEPQAPGTVHRVDGPCYVAEPQQEPCQTCTAMARTAMMDQVSFDRKPDCYAIRQITDDEGVEEWEDIRTSPDVAREEANNMMATRRGEVYEVVPLWTTPQPAPAPLSDDVARDAARYRFLAGHCRSTSEHWGGRWSIVVEGPAPKSDDSEDDFDAAIDAALAAQGGK